MPNRQRREAVGFQREPSTTARCSTLAFLVAVAFTCLNIYLSFHNAEHHVQSSSAHGVAAMEMDKSAKLKKQAVQSSLFTATDTWTSTKPLPLKNNAVVSSGNMQPLSPPSKHQPPVQVSSLPNRQQVPEKRKNLKTTKKKEVPPKKQTATAGVTLGAPTLASKAASKNSSTSSRGSDSEAYYAEFEEDFSYDSEGEEPGSTKTAGSRGGTQATAKKEIKNKKSSIVSQEGGGAATVQEKDMEEAPLQFLEPRGAAAAVAASSVSRPKPSSGSRGSSSRGDSADDVTYFGDDEAGEDRARSASPAIQKASSASKPLPIEEGFEYFGEEER